MKGEKMTKRVLCLLSVLLIGVLLFSSMAVVVDSKRTRWKWYENKEWKIKFKYPSKWEFEEGPVGGVDGVGVFKWVGVKKDIL
jgi:uncharacterized membrane protein affecting hemolysin expression